MHMYRYRGARSPGVRQQEDNFYPIGVEFEFEGVGMRVEVPGWIGLGDGSLRNHGAEYIFETPVRTRDDSMIRIRELLRVANTLQWQATVRTGVHVHVNVDDWDEDHLINTLLAYTLLEPAIYSYVGHSRDENPYCVPWYANPDSLERMLRAKWAYPTSPTRAHELISSSNKYSGLYIGPITRLGTIEFRHLLTSLDPERTEEWIDIVQAVCMAGERHDLQSRIISEEPEDLAHELVREIPALLGHQTAFGEIEVAGSFVTAIPWLTTTVDPNGWVMVHSSPGVAAPPPTANDPRNDFLNEILREHTLQLDAGEFEDEDDDTYHDEDYDEEDEY